MMVCLNSTAVAGRGILDPGYVNVCYEKSVNVGYWISLSAVRELPQFDRPRNLPML